VIKAGLSRMSVWHVCSTTSIPVWILSPKRLNRAGLMIGYIIREAIESNRPLPELNLLHLTLSNRVTLPPGYSER
jgi:hypothetical protein